MNDKYKPTKVSGFVFFSETNIGEPIKYSLKFSTPFVPLYINVTDTYHINLSSSPLLMILMLNFVVNILLQNFTTKFFITLLV